MQNKCKENMQTKVHALHKEYTFHNNSYPANTALAKTQSGESTEPGVHPSAQSSPVQSNPTTAAHKENDFRTKQQS